MPGWTTRSLAQHSPLHPPSIVHAAALQGGQQQLRPQQRARLPQLSPHVEGNSLRRRWCKQAAGSVGSSASPWHQLSLVSTCESRRSWAQDGQSQWQAKPGCSPGLVAPGRGSPGPNPGMGVQVPTQVPLNQLAAAPTCTELGTWSMCACSTTSSLPRGNISSASSACAHSLSLKLGSFSTPCARGGGGGAGRRGCWVGSKRASAVRTLRQAAVAAAAAAARCSSGRHSRSCPPARPLPQQLQLRRPHL